jgi:hypothetical protein
MLTSNKFSFLVVVEIVLSCCLLSNALSLSKTPEELLPLFRPESGFSFTTASLLRQCSRIYISPELAR